MDDIDYKAVSVNLATQLAEEIYQKAQYQNLAENLIKERNELKLRLSDLGFDDHQEVDNRRDEETE